MPRLCLASRSPHRQRLLREAGYDVVTVEIAEVEPSLPSAADPNDWLIEAAQRKALDALRRGAEGLIFAADTVGLVDGSIVGKPRDRADALRMLRSISGTSHDVLTGWCLWRTRGNLILCGVDRTMITMRPWQEAEFSAYLESGEWVGKSGAYGLRWPGDPTIVRIDGSPSNVIGVPLERLRDVLAQFPGLLR